VTREVQCHRFVNGKASAIEATSPGKPKTISLVMRFADRYAAGPALGFAGQEDQPGEIPATRRPQREGGRSKKGA